MKFNVFVNLLVKLLKKTRSLFNKENAWIFKGNQHLEKNELSQARHCYEQAIQHNASSATAHLNLAFVLKEQNKNDLAQFNLQQCLSINPLAADAWYLLGEINRKKSNIDEAINSFKKSIEINPLLESAYIDLSSLLKTIEKSSDFKVFMDKIIELHPTAWLPRAHLGAWHEQNGHYDEAISAYEHAISLNDSLANLYAALSSLYEQKADISKAETLLKKAIFLDKENLDLLEKFATFINNHRSHNEALALYEQIIRTNPDRYHLWFSIAQIHIINNRFEVAKQCLEKYQTHNKNDVIVNHLLDALNNKTPDYSPLEVTQKLFDGYAKNFEKHLTEVLKYNAPQKLVGLVLSHPSNHAHLSSVLDLGCGTGLVGKLLKNNERRIEGIDISANMLEKAKEAQCYDHLIHADLVESMRNAPKNNYDLIISADVFIYVGKLDEIFEEAARILTQEGLFAFTAEALDVAQPEATQGYILQKTARYAHHSLYIKQLAQKNGFLIQSLQLDQIRVDFGKPLMGWYVVCQKIIV